jgi:4-hydroxy-tetrahydrodipicolinate reductase
MSVLPVAIAGATGRMGSLVVRAVEADPGLALVARPLRGALDADWNGARALADFTSSEGTALVADLAAARGVGLVVGTTGLDAAATAALQRAAARVPVLIAPNLSPGVAALKRALAAALAALPGYDVEIVERHQPPRSTHPAAPRLPWFASSRMPARGDPAGRPEGRVGPRPPAEIGLHSSVEAPGRRARSRARRPVRITRIDPRGA